MWVNISQAAKLTGYKYGEIRRLIAKGAFPLKGRKFSSRSSGRTRSQ